MWLKLYTYYTVGLMDSNSTTLLQNVESFLYTPYGLGALAGASDR